MDEVTLTRLANHPDFKLLRRVPEQFQPLEVKDTPLFVATIIDLETMGLDAKAHEIIELGLLAFRFSTTEGIVDVVETYNELNDPGRPIPPEITKVTGIRDEDVKGKVIDWDYVLPLLKQSHVIICHNSRFDRNFLELQTPAAIQAVIEKKPFACTIQDIDWRNRGYESSKLDYLNFKLGFFYSGHRALVDCWATFNLLHQEPGAFEELKASVRRKDTLLCATNAAFDKKDLLKERNYRWSDGTGSLPKCWWTVVTNDLLETEKGWLAATIYGREKAAEALPTLEINAFRRYSYRAECLS